MRVKMLSVFVVLSLVSSLAMAQSQSRVPTPANPAANDTGIIQGVPVENRPNVGAPPIESNGALNVAPPAPANHLDIEAPIPAINSTTPALPLVEAGCNSCSVDTTQYMPLANDYPVTGAGCGCASAVMSYAGPYSAQAIQLWSGYSGTTHNYPRNRTHSGFWNRNSGRSTWFSRRGCSY